MGRSCGKGRFEPSPLALPYLLSDDLADLMDPMSPLLLSLLTDCANRRLDDRSGGGDCLATLGRRSGVGFRRGGVSRPSYMDVLVVVVAVAVDARCLVEDDVVEEEAELAVLVWSDLRRRSCCLRRRFLRFSANEKPEDGFEADDDDGEDLNLLVTLVIVIVLREAVVVATDRSELILSEESGASA